MKVTRTSLLIAAALLAASSLHLLAARGDLYVSNLATNTVDVYAPDGTKSIFASGLSSPQGLAFDQEHNLYVADAVTGEIYKYDPAGNRTTFYSGLSAPLALAIDHRGNLLVSESGTGLLFLIPLDQGAPKTFPFGSPEHPILGLATAPGKRFVTESDHLDWYNSDNSGTAMFFNADTRGVTAVARGGGPYANATAFVSVSNGEIWLANTNLVARRLFASGLSDPNGMAFLPGHGSGGELYVADRGTGRIWKYSLDGIGSVFVSDAGTPNYLATGD